MTEQLIDIIRKYYDKLNNIVNSKSTSFIETELLNVIELICKDNKVEWCSHCPSTIYRAIVFAFGLFNKLNNNDDGIENKENSDRQTVPDKKLGKKRKSKKD